MDIKELRPNEMQEIIDFYYHIKEYGHIYHFGNEDLENSFNKILEGISEIKELMNESWEM